MCIRDLIISLEAFARKHGDCVETGVDGMYGGNPIVPLLIHEEKVILVEMVP